MNVFCVAVFCAAAIAPLVAQQPSADRVIRLFNGKDLEGFDTFLKSKGLNSDPDKVFQVHDGMIHVLGTDYGYIITKKEYENFHLKAEFKWGDRTHPPRKDVARDSGILFHVEGPDQVWPKSIEYQIMGGGPER